MREKKISLEKSSNSSKVIWWEVARLRKHSEGFPGSSDSKESACNAGDLGSIPGLGTSLGGEHGNPLQYVCLENAMDRGAWWATVHGVT